MTGKSGAAHAGVPNTQSKHVGEVLGSEMVRTGEAATTRTMVLGERRMEMTLVFENSEGSRETGDGDGSSEEKAEVGRGLIREGK